MKDYLLRFQTWYEQRQLREQVLVLVLIWAFLYAFYYYVFDKRLNHQAVILNEQIKNVKTQINSWKIQIDALQKLSATPFYKQWLAQRKLFESLQGQYKFLQKNSPAKQWQDVIKTVLQSQTNITLVQIKNLPETAYNPNNITGSSNVAKLYQQQLLLVIMSNYFDTINYLQQLEKVLPHIHWDSLNYQVVQYPAGKVDMEFSIFYEKTD